MSSIKSNKPSTFLINLCTTFLILLCLFAGLADLHAFSTIQVSSLIELKQELVKGNPGDVFVLKDGQYGGKPIVLEGQGSRIEPIIIRAKQMHQAKIGTTLQLRGSFISLIDCAFNHEGNLTISGEGIRLSRCVFNNSKAKKWVQVESGSKQIEIDHNHFENKTSNIGNKGCQLLQVVVLNQNERHHIHHNLFKDIPKGTENNGNGYETVQLITKNNPFNPAPGDCNTIIEYNLFVRANGEAEIISIKSNGNIIRNNTFRACRGGLVLRHGHGNVATANIMIGDGEEKASGIRIQGRDQIIANNYFANLGGYGVAMMDGTPDDLYVRVENGLIAFNTFIDCKKVFEIGLNHPKHPTGTTPKGCQIIGNLLHRSTPKVASTYPSVVLVNEDEPEHFIWRGNISFGGEQFEIKGISHQDPYLIQRPDGIFLPTEKTPSTSTPGKVIGNFQADLCGKQWTNQRSIGAIQYPVQYDPIILVDDMVGPFAK